ncbi:MAG: UDP-N-acetylmuramoyl-L-alanine--D-glutamate ligase [Oscillospiraceae bacterium]|nr:UDP-N-acetylmuramoyl-L-alanine--D-glutamate ligase [Oscillospiraceae bacterium]
MMLSDYMKSLAGKRVAVVGIGVSNRPLIELLAKGGIATIACDKKPRSAFGVLADELEAQGVELRLGETYLDELDADVVFRTPGMRPDVPALERIRVRGGSVTSEMEVFFSLCPCPIIGITGSDGRTTTSSIVAELLKAEGKKVHLGGNIGRPLLYDVDEMQPEDIAVVELSSFQLMDMTRSPQTAVLTNLSPNHLDVHKDMDEYVAAKENIFRFQSAADRAVFNYDNAITRELAEKAVGDVTFFSKEKCGGVYLENGVIYADGREVLPVSEILLPGMHNVENYMAAIAAVKDLVSDETIRRVAASFGGVEHRIEFVREVGGVRYYNDSIASSPTRTIAGLRAFPQKVILIAGGYDKQIPFTELAPEVTEHVKLLILCGDTAEKIRTCVLECDSYAGSPEIVLCDSLEEAVGIANERAESGDIVTLSPACAAFDKFPNFMVRGETYKKLVNAL